MLKLGPKKVCAPPKRIVVDKKGSCTYTISVFALFEMTDSDYLRKDPKFVALREQYSDWIESLRDAFDMLEEVHGCIKTADLMAAYLKKYYYSVGMPIYAHYEFVLDVIVQAHWSGIFYNESILHDDADEPDDLDEKEMDGKESNLERAVKVACHFWKKMPMVHNIIKIIGEPPLSGLAYMGVVKDEDLDASPDIQIFRRIENHPTIKKVASQHTRNHRRLNMNNLIRSVTQMPIIGNK